MIELEEKLGLANAEWLMSAREKLALIGLLELLKPKKVIEFGYHRGGATKWLSEYSKSLITVDVNEFVSQAEDEYANVIAWNCPTQEAINKIAEESMQFDLAIVDADHSRKAVGSDVTGLLGHAKIILMHDSSNPECRKGMLDALKGQKKYRYYLDFITSTSKHDGLWGGMGIAFESENAGSTSEFDGELSPYPMLKLQNSMHLRPKIKAVLTKIQQAARRFISRGKIIGGRLLGR